MKAMLRAILPKIIWLHLSIIKRILFPNGAISLKKVNFVKNKDKVIVLGNGPLMSELLSQNSKSFLYNQNSKIKVYKYENKQQEMI